MSHRKTSVFFLSLLASTGCKEDKDPSGGNPGETPAVCYTLADGDCVEETFANPPVLTPDADGVHTLTLAPTEVTIDGQRHCVRAYNGMVPGPTIETPVGADRQVRVNLVNNFLSHDFRDLGGDDTCTCTNSAGGACYPKAHHACEANDDDCSCVSEDGDVCEHMFDFNVTNLHAHGSHARPDYARGGEVCTPGSTPYGELQCRECGEDTCDGDDSDNTCYFADDVISTVHPGMGAQYRWDIDEDGTHHDGLQWYHPHIHGTTAIQVASGAAGAWLVRGPIDSLDGVQEARERVMVFSTPSVEDNGFTPLAEGEVCSEDTLTFNNFKVLGSTTAPQLNVLNGARQPRLITAPDQVERWRLLHAGFLDEVFMGVFRGTDANCTDWSVDAADTLPLHQIARDGLTLPQTFDSDYLFLSPGYRIEFLIGGAGQLQHGDTWCLVASRFLQDNDGTQGGFAEGPTSPAEPPTVNEINQALFSGDLVAILNVTEDFGVATETQLPTDEDLAAIAPPLTLGGQTAEDLCSTAAAVSDPKDIDQAAILQVGFFTADDPDPCECQNYNVNCKNFEYVDRSTYPYDRDLPLDAVEHWRVGASFDGHPFHIHINPYLVCPNDNVFDPIPFPHWRDTYLINMGRKVDVITQYKSYTGAFVFHCHKLTHEDDGMMQLLRVCDPATDPSCGDYTWRQCADDDLACIQALAATDCTIQARSDAEMAACVTVLGGPLGVCGPNACVEDAECPPTQTCQDNVCAP